MEVPTGHDRRSRLEQYRLFVGIDWATEKHQVCIVDAHGERVSEREVEHRGPALEELAVALLKAAEGRPEHVAVGIEVPHGTHTCLRSRYARSYRFTAACSRESR